MKVSRRLWGLCLLFVLLPVAWGQLSPFTISKVEIEHRGPPAVSDEFIRANIRVKAGDPYLPSAVDEDVRNLYNTGFFYNIRIVVSNATEGLELTYILQGKPRLMKIRFKGNRK